MATSVVVDRVGGPVATSTATFDPTRTYRFHLSRTWDPAGPVVAFVMLNPSTADAHRLDPTVRRCVGFAAAWGFGALEVVNLFAFRATDPTDLSRCRDPVGTGNDRVVLEVARRADRVVVAWGTAVSAMAGPVSSRPSSPGAGWRCTPWGRPSAAIPGTPSTSGPTPGSSRGPGSWPTVASKLCL